MTTLRTSLLCLLVAGAAACQANDKKTTDNFEFDGTCVNCHTGLGAAQVHPTFKLRCVDCHGGDDQVAVPTDAATDVAVYRDPDLLKQAHVLPKPDLARFFWANGVDDDGDGTVDEGPTFDDPVNPTKVVDFGEVAEPGLHGEGMGEFLDSEFNRDLNYVRFINPGDLRVAAVGCGGAARASADGGGCHQDIVENMRRSIMVNMGTVLNGAYYGNESWRTKFQMARDDGGAAADPRAGAYGYVLDYTAADGCIDASALDGDLTGRAQPVFDSSCLEAAAAADDPNANTDAPGNAGLPPFEIAQGAITGPAPGVTPGTTAVHTGAKHGRFPWGGKPLLNPVAALLNLEAPPFDDLVPGIPDPVDLVLRGFRAYYPLNYQGSTLNFNFTFGTSIQPEIAQFKTADPFGRGHSSGCTSCHMRYNPDGSRSPQKVAVEQDGKRVLTDVVDPTTKHREFDISQDIATVDVGGGEMRDQLVGRAVKQQEQLDTGRQQQRYYSAEHKLTTRIDTDTCGNCHGFVTRINYAFQGMAEDEQRDALARHKPIEFDTPAGTHVRVLDSWVRMEKDTGNLFNIVIPDGSDIVAKAFARDEELAAKGLVPGAGGCAAATFTEDCNNDGELETQLVLTRVDERGNTVATATINEDLNGNGSLDLIDHVPREKSIDGRQMRYVYGGANGSTRQMDIHFERGMHCIDCHMLQDAHGDGNLYSTNWDAVEVECEDCHGTRQRATLFTSGANGGNDLRRAIDQDGRPFFEDQGSRILQRSRVTPGVFWEVPQVADGLGDPLLAEAHKAEHLPDQAPPGAHNVGSTFAGEQGKSELQVAKMECYTCHTSWTHNCMGCHLNENLGDKIRTKVNPDGSLEKVAGDNEIWFNNSNQGAETNFQLLGFLRSPFVLGVDASADAGRLAPFRSSMEAQVSVTDTTGDTLFDNLSFTTFQGVDANSGRANVATSAVAMNQTLPHTVRPKEVKGCETCHALVDKQGRIENEHILAETYGLGAGRYPYLGDWAMMAGLGGIELYDYKQERELNGNVVGASTRYPGLIVDPADRILANIEPVLDGADGIDATFAGTDIALIRNFNPTPAPGGTQQPTLVDLAVTTVSNGASGALILSDITHRGHRTLAGRPSVGDAAKVFVLALPGPAQALAHLSPDVSDPFVYVAVAGAGVSVVHLLDAPSAAGPAAEIATTVGLEGGKTATEVVLAGDVLYVGTAEGTVEAYDLADPLKPVFVSSTDVGGGTVHGLALGGFELYAATDNGLAVLSVIDPQNPAPAGADALGVPGVAMRELTFSSGHVYVAAGAAGVLDIDVTIPAAPQNLGNLVTQLAPTETVDASDVVMSAVPGQNWLLVAEASGNLVGLKLDHTQSLRERCFPDPAAAGCTLDMDFRDPTIMGRDPSFDPNTGTFFAGDPSGQPFFRIPAVVVGSGNRLARPAIWEQIGTLTGRRLRDSFMPGSGVLSLPVMQTMHNVEVCEVPGTPSVNGSGLGELGQFTNGKCVPFGQAAGPPPPDDVCVSTDGDGTGTCDLPAPVTRPALGVR